MDKCFCHFNGYKVKDADARKQLEGKASMGDIRVSGIKCKNEFNELEARTISNYKSNNNIGSGWYSLTIDLQPNTEYTITRFANNVTTDGNYNLQFYLYEDVVNPLFYVNNRVAEQTMNNKVRTFTTGESGKLYLATLYGNDTRLTTLFNNIDIQIEKGNVSTEYVPYFEIGSSSKGFYQLELPIGMITPGENFMGDNALPTECNTKLQELLNTIRKDNCKSPIVVIKNTIEKSTYQGVEIDNPIQLTLTNMRVTEPSGENAGRFDFYGISDYLDSIYVSEDGKEHIRYDAMLSVPFKLNGGSVDLTDCVGSISLRQYTLVTKEYVDTMLDMSWGEGDSVEGEGSSTNTSTANIVDLVTDTAFNDNVDLADIKDAVESAMDKFLKGETSVPSFILKHNRNKSAINSVLLTFSTNSNNVYKFKGFGMYILGNGSLSINEIVLTANMSSSVDSSTGNYKLNLTPSIVVTSKSI